MKITWEVSDIAPEPDPHAVPCVLKSNLPDMQAFVLPGNQYSLAEYLTALEEVAERAQSALGALANRWVRVDCTPEEERTIRELNDAYQALPNANVRP